MTENFIQKTTGALRSAISRRAAAIRRTFKPRTGFDATLQEAEATDWGRRYGWFVERDGERIGELDYIRWDSRLQLWHDYRLSWRNPEDAVYRPDEWLEAGLMLRNRLYADVVITDFMISHPREDGVISLRGVFVPKEIL